MLEYGGSVVARGYGFGPRVNLVSVRLFSVIISCQGRSAGKVDSWILFLGSLKSEHPLAPRKERLPPLVLYLLFNLCIS